MTVNHQYPSATPSVSLSLIYVTPPSSSSYWQPQPSPLMPNLDSFNPVMSSPNTITPFLGQQPFPFPLNTQNPQSVSDMAQQFFQAIPTPDMVRRTFPSDWSPDISNVHIQRVRSFERKTKGEAGEVQVPGLNDLPECIRSNFCNMFIHHIIKLIFSDMSPWSNLSLSVYQHEFNLIYPLLRYRLHADDAVVIPVTVSIYFPNIISNLPFHRPIVTWAGFETKSVPKPSLQSSSTCLLNIPNAC